MKNKFGREILLLTLPLLVLGGVAFWKSRSGAAQLWVPQINLKDNGPVRVEYSAFQSVEVPASSVARGFSWAGKTRVVARGQAIVPANMKEAGGGLDLKSGSHLVYRKGSIWKEAWAYGGVTKLVVSIERGMNDDLTIHLNLDDVPKDADEIRFKGAINVQKNFNGIWPRNIKPPKNATVYPNMAVLSYDSKPFDIVVKGPKDPRPNPIVSHDPGIKFVRAYHIIDSLKKVFVTVQLRRPTTETGGEETAPSLFSYKLLDADGHEVDVCDTGKGSRYYPAYFGATSRDVLAKDVPATDVFIRVWSNVEPCKSQKNLKLPLMLQMEFSDAGKWPLKVKVPIDTKTYDSFNKYPFR